MIENRINTITIRLNDEYSIMKWKNLELWYLQYYNFGRNYMPIDLYADKSLMKVYNYFNEMR